MIPASAILGAARRRNAGGTFNPLSISGCVLWLKADGSVYNTGTTQATDGQDVATWVDASGSGNNATGYGAIKPKFETNTLNGKPVVQTNGVHAYLKGSVSITGTALTAFIVSNTGNVGSAYGRMLDLANAAGGNYAANDACTAFTMFGGANFNTGQNNNFPSAITSAFGVPFVGTSSYSGSNCYVRKNGGSANSASASGTFVVTQYSVAAEADGNSIGGPQDIAEILVYNAYLGTTDREAVEDYLGSKYGITITH